MKETEIKSQNYPLNLKYLVFIGTVRSITNSLVVFVYTVASVILSYKTHYKPHLAGTCLFPNILSGILSQISLIQYPFICPQMEYPELLFQT